MNKQWEIDNSTLKTKCGWSPFDGLKVYGSIQNVILRGKVVYQEGQILAEKGFGEKSV